MATYKVKAYGKEYTVEVLEQASGARVLVEGCSFEVGQAAPEVPAAPAAAAVVNPAGGSGRGAVCAPIPGVITKVCVAEGEVVTAGQVVVKLEAMKMENDITALVAGTVRQVAVAEGADGADGQLLVLVE
jgi:biotin carboxyl carrier protein